MATQPVVDPATGNTIADVPRSGQAEVNAAVAAEVELETKAQLSTTLTLAMRL